MSGKTYERYKESGLTWLGKVPSTWTVTAMKHGYDIKLGKMLQPEQKGDKDELAAYIRAANIQWQGVETSDIKLMWFSPSERLDLILKKEDLLVSEGGDVGRACLWRNELSNCYFQNSVNRARSKPGNSTRFAKYWLSTLKDKGFIDVICNKSTIAHYTAEKLSATPVLLPSHSEQLAIATFLDRETAKIDNLIVEQERLIELLQEKRQAVISHAVTKGLNPDAPMKDSGVEWLGEVPEHWEVGPIKRFLSSMNYKRVPLSSEERSSRQGNYPYYGASGIIDSVDDFLFNESLVLVSEDGANLLMRSTPIAFEAHGEYWVNNHAHILRPNDGLTLFWSERIESVQIAPFVTGSAQPKLTAEALLNLTISCPLDLEEKKAIEERIQTARSELEPLIEAAENAVKLLRESRSALISAAVTGQIDVRGLVPEQEAV